MKVTKTQESPHHFEILTENHLEEVCELLYLSFNDSNPLWRKFNLTHAEMIPYLKYRITPSIKTQTSSVLICDNKIVGCQVSIDYVDYMDQRKENKVKIPTAFTYHSVAINDILDANRPRGHTLVSQFTAIHPEYQSRSFYPAINLYSMRVLKLGYVCTFALTTNPISKSRTESYPDTKLIKSVIFDDKTHPLYGVRFDLFEVPHAQIIIQAKAKL